MRKKVLCLESKGRGGWVVGHWIGTIERGKKRGWYRIDFTWIDTEGKLGEPGALRALPFEGRRRKRPFAVRPDRIRLYEE